MGFKFFLKAEIVKVGMIIIHLYHCSLKLNAVEMGVWNEKEIHEGKKSVEHVGKKNDDKTYNDNKDEIEILWMKYRELVRKDPRVEMTNLVIPYHSNREIKDLVTKLNLSEKEKKYFSPMLKK